METWKLAGIAGAWLVTLTAWVWTAGADRAVAISDIRRHEQAITALSREGDINHDMLVEMRNDIKWIKSQLGSSLGKHTQECPDEMAAK